MNPSTRQRLRKSWPWVLLLSFWVAGYLFIGFWMWLGAQIPIAEEGIGVTIWRFLGVTVLAAVWGSAMFLVWRKWIRGSDSVT